MQGQALERALQRAGATGEFIEEGATGDPQETLESRLRTAQLTGDLGGQQTLAGRQAEMDQVGAVLAALDPAMKGRADPLAEALGADLQQAEQSRRQFDFNNEVDALMESGEFDIDKWFQLADKYDDMPSIAAGLQDMIDLQTSPNQDNFAKEYDRLTKIGMTESRRRRLRKQYPELYDQHVANLEAGGAI
jgi:hypothetical protein